MKKNLLDSSVYHDSIERIHLLNSESIPLWGKMDVAQMLAHCSEVMDVYNGDKSFGKVSWIAKLFKKMVYDVVAGDKPYGKSGPTLPQFKIMSKKKFEIEKERLIASIQKFYTSDSEQRSSLKHPLFGTLSDEEIGWAMYKHLNHHLVQFGV